MAMGPLALLLMVVGALVAIPIIVILIMKVLVPIFQGIGWVVRHVFRFIGGEIGDVLRMVGSVVTAGVLTPMVLISILLGRWSASAHYGRAFKSEIKTLGVCGYRCLVGHPARLLGLSTVTDGIERRIPQVVAAAPGPDRPGKRVGQFDGYKIVGSLAGGGSGGKLYVAEPDAMKLASFERAGHADVGRVVIKVFSTGDGSSLPQIIRESRALEAAKKLGLILDHDLTNDRFFYVMKYIPGESLGLVTQRLHAASGSNGLGRSQLATTLGVARDLLSTLDAYHLGGLWHKDVKPDNIIVEGARAHLVDLGLVTPMRSAMTLTTHGTEYFRDPEMVRMALKGVKVHQVNGAKFDVYAAGAVLYSMIENSFPAHGGLSQISKSCPESLRWIVRRAMTEYDKRYASAREMLDDLEVVAASADPFAIRPADLPSVRGGGQPVPEPAPAEMVMGAVHAAAASPAASMAQPLPTPDPLLEPAPSRAPIGAPRLRVTNWLTGRYEPDGERVAAREARGTPRPPREPSPAGREPYTLDLGFMKMVAGLGTAANPKAGARTPAPGRRSAAEQLTAARSRAAAARQRAHSRMRSRARPGSNYASGINAGIGGAILLAGIAFVAIFALTNSRRSEVARQLPAPAVPSPATPEPPAPTLADILPTPAPRIDVLVLDDVSANLPDEARAHGVRVALDRLEDAGFVLLGNYPGAAATGEALDRELFLAAQARSRVGQLPLDSEEMRQTMQAWLSEQDGTTLALWMNEPTPGQIEYRLFAPEADGASPGRESTVLGRVIGLANDLLPD